MADSSITKRALGEALKKLLRTKSFSKICIGEICDLCNMNRKSFYYHFHDKYELVVWIFESEFLNRIDSRDSESIWRVARELCDYFYENKHFYKKILQVYGQNSFSEYFLDACEAAFTEKIRSKEGFEEIPLFTIELYASYFVLALYKWLKDDSDKDGAAFFREFVEGIISGSNLLLASLKEEHFIN